MPGRGEATRVVGLDFVSFYTAGSAVREGRAGDLYKLDAVRRFQAVLEEREGIAIGKHYAPWWNPPFYALLFVPLAGMSFHLALWVWLIGNVVCGGIACWLLCRMLPEGAGWKLRGLVPVLMALSMPFMQNMTHGQNSCTSLLILTGVVWFWRAGRAWPAGMVAGLLFYKPQLAVVVVGMMVLDLGWRAAAGVVVTGAGLLVVSLVVLPGAMGDFLSVVPDNLHFVQEQSVYPWARHVTFKGFWRVLLQGEAVGPTRMGVNVLSVLGMGMVGTTLLKAVLTRRGIGLSALRRDRVIAATIAATPLLMPFYFDYDLLLLAIPAVLLAREIIVEPQINMADRILIALFATLYGWLLINPDVAEQTRVNLAVVLLAGVAGLLIRRVNGQAAASCVSVVRPPVLSSPIPS